MGAEPGGEGATDAPETATRQSSAKRTAVDRDRRGNFAAIEGAVPPHPASAHPVIPPEPPARLTRILILITGLVACQFVLHGPSLIGTRILLPLDLLALPGVYLPEGNATAGIIPHDPVRSDLLYQFEIERRFVARELAEGRMPFWLPYQYGGVPLVWPRFSPLILLSCLTESPRILAWAQLAAALTAGLGAYLFLRRALGVSFWAAVFPAWCFPISGFLVLWQGFPTCGSVHFLPWLLLAVDASLRRPGRRATAGVAVATLLVLIGGHIDVAGQVLLLAGVFAAGRLWRIRRAGGRAGAAAWRLAAGWLLGFMLAAPHVVPLLDYARTGARIERRGTGTEERPPGHPKALALVALPDGSGASRAGSLWLESGNQIESAAAAYAGLIALLFAAPLAWTRRERRAEVWFWLGAGAFGLGWSLGLPGVIQLLRLPGLNMMSHNRLVFWTGFALLALAAVGLDSIRDERRRPAWGWAWAVAAAMVTLWCTARAFTPPEPVATQLATLISQGKSTGWIKTTAEVAAVQGWFRLAAAAAAGLGAAAVAAWWFFLRTGPRGGSVLLVATGMLMVADLLWFARDRSTQADPRFDFPRLPVLEQVARAPAGRIVGFGCLPAALADSHGLRDIRGYDSIDPSALMRVLDAVADPDSPRLPYAQAQWFVPRAEITAPDNLRLPPVIDLLDVRYAIFRGPVPPGFRPAFAGDDHWVLENRRAVGRTFFPGKIEVAPEEEIRRRITSSSFEPLRLALIEYQGSPPAAARGTARIVQETPDRVVLESRAEASGLLVLTDAWDPGWRAYVDDREAPVMRVNTLVRGVVVPAGLSRVEFRFRPRTWNLSLALAGAAAALVLWLALRRNIPSSAPSAN